MSDFLARLESFLAERKQPLPIQQLTPDASTREYFRVGWKGGSAIACVYPDAFIEREQSYLDVTNLFQTAGLPVARVLDFDEQLGVIVIEDFGDRILREEMQDCDEERREDLIVNAIDLIPKIQVATKLAYETDSIASRLKFDSEKLLWELKFFKEHYFTTFKKQPLPPEVDAALTAEFKELCVELETKATVLCHRDFHAANLMLDSDGSLKIIDHQDARIGSVAYDLVSFLLDRVTEPPTAEWLADKRRHFIDERTKLGLETLDEKDFAEEFRLQTIQRCLKAVGTFSFQSVNRGKTYFVPFIEPMFQIVLRAIDNLGRFENLRTILQRVSGVVSMETRSLFEDELKKRGIAFSIDPESGRHSAKLGETSFLVSLENLEKEVVKTEQHDSGRIARFVDSIVEITLSAPLTFSLDRLFWTLEPNDYAEPPDIRVSISDRVDRVLVHLSAEASSIVWVTPQILDTLGLSEVDASRIAFENLDAALSTSKLEFSEINGVKLGFIVTDLPFKSSLILAPSLRKFAEPVLGWPLLAVLPDRDFLYLWASGESDLVNRMGVIVIEEYQTAAYPISTEVYEITGESIEAIGEFPTPADN